MKATPLARVRTDFGSKQALVDQILPLLESRDEETRSVLMGTTNAKLLRIHETAQEVKSRFGSRKNLVEAILKARYPNGNPDDGYLKRVEEATMKRLLEMHRQVVKI